MITIRRFTPQDWSALWKLEAPVFRTGETYPFSPDIAEEDACKAWIESPSGIYVATVENQEALGTYYIKPSQSALGAHVNNFGHIVGAHTRRKGFATSMCEHSQREAVDQGFNSVGTLPGAFRRRRLRFVDAFVMYKQLDK